MARVVSGRFSDCRPGAGGLIRFTMLTLLTVHVVDILLNDVATLFRRRPPLRSGEPASDQHHRHHDQVMA